MKELPPTKVADPSTQECIVEALDAECTFRHQRPDIHESRPAKTDDRSTDQEFGGVTHVDTRPSCGRVLLIRPTDRLLIFVRESEGTCPDC